MTNETVREFLRSDPQAPASTPWGAPQAIHRLAEGIYRVSAASHGGFYLGAQRMAELQAMVGEALAHPFAAAHAPDFSDGSGWFEEDEAGYLVRYFFHREVDAGEEPTQHVCEQMRALWPAYFAAAQGGDRPTIARAQRPRA